MTPVPLLSEEGEPIEYTKQSPAQLEAGNYSEQKCKSGNTSGVAHQ